MNRIRFNRTRNARSEIKSLGFTDAQIDRMTAIVRRYPETYGPFNSDAGLSIVRNMCIEFESPEGVKASGCCLAEAI